MWFQRVPVNLDLAHNLGEQIKFDFTKFLFQPRGCMTSLKVRDRLRPPEANQCWGCLDPHIWYSNDFPKLQDVKNDLSLEQPQVASSDLGFLKRSYSLEAGIKILRNQILCIHTKFQPNRTMGTSPNKLCNIRGYARPKWRSKFIDPKIFQLILKIPIIFDIKSARYVQKVPGHPFKTCHQVWSFTSKSNIEVAIKSAVLRLDKKYSGIDITSYEASIPHIEELIR